MNVDQQEQLKLIKRFLKPVLDFEEIPTEGRYYLKNDEKENHWLYTELKLIGSEDGKLLFTLPNGITKDFDVYDLRNVLIYKP